MRLKLTCARPDGYWVEFVDEGLDVWVHLLPIKIARNTVGFIEMLYQGTIEAEANSRVFDAEPGEVGRPPGRLGKIGAFEPCAIQRRATQLCAGQVRAFEISPFEVSPSQVCAIKMSAFQISARQ